MRNTCLAPGDSRCRRKSQFLFFSSRRRHTRCSRDWSSDVCSSDLGHAGHLTAAVLGSSPPASEETRMIRVPVKRLAPSVPLPAYARDGDAGLDLHAAHDVTLPPGGRALVGTGLAVAIPPGHAGFVLPRSGLALKHGVTILNAPGLIDAGYRGELKVLLVNHDPATTVTLRRGERVAQLVLQRVERAEPLEVDELPASERGAGGFGSTGA